MSDDVVDKESEFHDQRLGGNNSGNEETQGASSQLHMEVKNELRSEKSEHINYYNVVGDMWLDQGDLKPLDLKDGSVKIEQNDVGSTKVIENIEATISADELSKIPVNKPENAHVSGFGDEAKFTENRVPVPVLAQNIM
ncbi:unnamed protein product [Lupinus luteus]|uniref:Uncharacterized protein n=1 Tax=Lupinus luteus TaxID=3873 RepID=A0AAV1XNZ3_LUPLU